MDRFYTNLVDKFEGFFQSSDEPANVAPEEEAEIIERNSSSESELEPLRPSQVDGYWTNFIDPKCFKEFQAYGLENSDLELFGDLSLSNDFLRNRRINSRKLEYLSDKLPKISLNEDAMVDDASESGDSMAANAAFSGSRSALSSVVDADDISTLNLLDKNKEDRDAPSSPKSCPPDASDKQYLSSTEELDSKSGEASGGRESRRISKLCSHGLVLEECERCSDPTPHFLSPDTARKVKSPVKPRSHSAIPLSPRKLEPIPGETKMTRVRKPSMPKKRLSQDDDDDNVGENIEKEMASKKRRASRDETGDSSKN